MQNLSGWGRQAFETPGSAPTPSTPEVRLPLQRWFPALIPAVDHRGLPSGWLRLQGHGTTSGSSFGFSLTGTLVPREKH